MVSLIVYTNFNRIFLIQKNIDAKKGYECDEDSAMID